MLDSFDLLDASIHELSLHGTVQLLLFLQQVVVVFHFLFSFLSSRDHLYYSIIDENLSSKGGKNKPYLK